MGKNRIVKTYNVDSTWTAPAGVTKVRVVAKPYLQTIFGTRGNGGVIVDSLGDVWQWGGNVSGQLGDGTVTNRSSPVQVLGLSNPIRQAAVGVDHALFLDTDGHAYGVGYNGEGEIGDNTRTNKSTAVSVVGNLRFRQVAGSNQSSYGIAEDGQVWAWGHNSDGQLGDNSITDKSSPIQVTSPASYTGSPFQLRQISGLSDAAIGLGADGVMYAWGNNGNGRLGDNSTTAKSTPVQVAGSLSVKKIHASTFHSFALTEDGDVYAWGRNANGELGDNTTADKSSPVQVVGGLKFIAITCQSTHGGGITEDFDAYTWGQNNLGQLGDNTTVDKSSPVQVVGGLKFREIYAQQSGFSAVALDGTVWAWGRNNISGDVGDGTLTNRSSPVQVLGNLTAKFNSNSFVADIDVVPGTSYDITLNAFTSYFGSIPLKTLAEELVLIYEA